MRFKLLLLLLPLLPGPLLSAAGFSIRDLTVPMFDAAGQRTQTLTAASAEGSFERPVLKSGSIEFHTALGENVAAGSTLRFDEAVYDKAGGFVEGTKGVRFASSDRDLSGVGFRYEVATGQLKLHRDVLLELKDEKYKGVKIHGVTADALIRQDPASGDWGVVEARVNGPVFATDVTILKVRYDRIETDWATYSAANGLVTFAGPIIGWVGAQKVVLSGQSLKYQLDPAPSADPAPSPAPASEARTP